MRNYSKMSLVVFKLQAIFYFKNTGIRKALTIGQYQS